MDHENYLMQTAQRGTTLELNKACLSLGCGTKADWCMARGAIEHLSYSQKHHRLIFTTLHHRAHAMRCRPCPSGTFDILPALGHIADDLLARGFPAICAAEGVPLGSCLDFDQRLEAPSPDKTRHDSVWTPSRCNSWDAPMLVL